MRGSNSGWSGLGPAMLISVGALVLAAIAPARAGEPLPAKGDASLFKAEEVTRGAIIFKENCAVCHDRGVGHAPPTLTLRNMLPAQILKALSSGPMRIQAQGLTDGEKFLVAEYLANRKISDTEDHLTPPKCSGASAVFDRTEPPVFDGWGLSSGNRRSITTRTAGLAPKDLPRLRLKWAMGFPGAIQVRSHPALAGGAIYVGSQSGEVYALDRSSGCIRWVFEAAAEVRTGIVVSPWKVGDAKARPLAYFGDLVGNVYAVDAQTGALAWRDHAEQHASVTITAAPVLSNGRLYVPVSSLEEANIDPAYPCCTFRGSVIAYDAGSGKRLWQSYTVPPSLPQGRNAAGTPRFGPSGAAIWNTPAVDERRDQLYVATGDNYSSPATGMSDSIVAMDLANGAIRWVYQALENDAWNGGCAASDRTLCPDEDGPDFDFGAPPILATSSAGQDIVLAGQKSGDVYGIDPDSGKLIWRNRVGRGGLLGGIYFGMAVYGDALFVPVTDAPDGKRYEFGASPGLYALDIRTGQRLWSAPDPDVTCNGRPFCSPGIASAITATPSMVLTGGSDGWLRFYDARTGEVLWRFDTARRFKTSGGGEAMGGSIGGGVAPIVYRGTMIVPSGYGFAGKMPGNVMLVFGLDEAKTGDDTLARLPPGLRHDQ